MMLASKLRIEMSCQDASTPRLGAGWTSLLTTLPVDFHFSWETIPQEVVLLALERAGLQGVSLDDAKRAFRETQQRGDKKSAALLRHFNDAMDDFTACRREFSPDSRFAYVYLYYAGGSARPV